MDKIIKLNLPITRESLSRDEARCHKKNVKIDDRLKITLDILLHEMENSLYLEQNLVFIVTSFSLRPYCCYSYYWSCPCYCFDCYIHYNFVDLFVIIDVVYTAIVFFNVITIIFYFNVERESCNKMNNTNSKYWMVLNLKK